MAAGNKSTSLIIDRMVSIMNDYTSAGEFFNDPNGDNIAAIQLISRGDVLSALTDLSTTLMPQIRVFPTLLSPELIYTTRHEHDLPVTIAILGNVLDVATVETEIWDYTDEMIHFIFSESISGVPVRKWIRSGDDDLGIYDTLPGDALFIHDNPAEDRFVYRSEINVIIKRSKATL
jgi:hypothetical protein